MYDISSRSRVILAHGTLLHRIFTVAEEHGWKIYTDANHPYTFHLRDTATTDDEDDLYISVVSDSNYGFLRAIPWERADQFGDSRIWIPRPLSEDIQFGDLVTNILTRVELDRVRQSKN